MGIGAGNTKGRRGLRCRKPKKIQAVNGYASNGLFLIADLICTHLFSFR